MHPENQAFLETLTSRHELHQLIDQLPPTGQAFLIVKRADDNAVAFQSFGDSSPMDIIYMLEVAKSAILTPAVSMGEPE